MSGIGLQKVYFDEKGVLNSGSIEHSQLIVIDKDAVPRPTPRGIPAYPVRRLPAETLAEWIESLNPVSVVTFRTAQPLSGTTALTELVRDGEADVPASGIKQLTCSVCIQGVSSTDTVQTTGILHLVFNGTELETGSEMLTNYYTTSENLPPAFDISGLLFTFSNNIFTVYVKAGLVLGDDAAYSVTVEVDY